MTEAAQAAKEVRKALKENFKGVKFSVTSESYSMGNSVNIDWQNGPSRSEVESIVNKYKKGNFDGMTDSFDYSNVNKDIPQVKFIDCHRWEVN